MQIARERRRSGTATACGSGGGRQLLQYGVRQNDGGALDPKIGEGWTTAQGLPTADTMMAALTSRRRDWKRRLAS